MKMIPRTVTLREDQNQALLTLAAKRQLEKGSRVSVSDINREAIDFYLAHHLEAITVDTSPSHPQN